MPRRCKECGLKAPCFGFTGERASRCQGCKLIGMVNVQSRKCVVCRKKQPSFGMPGEKASHCAECKSAAMVNTLSRKCAACHLRLPSFGFVVGSSTHCGKCKLPGMIDSRSPKCIKCRVRRATFGQKVGRPTHCSSCKLPGMLNKTAKKCARCHKKQVGFGFPGGAKTHCGGCREPGMVLLGKMCEGCQTTKASFGRFGGQPTHCSRCKLSEMTDLANPKESCVSCGLTNRRNLLKEGLCADCRRERPRAELVMRHHLQKHIQGRDWQFNKTPGGISICADKKYRPDAWLEMPGHVLIVECDEDQHKNYNVICELKRIPEVLAACEGKPLIFIRWNPDDFSVQGVQQKVSENRRLTALRRAVQAAIFAVPAQPLTVQYMFYDDDREKWLQSKLRSALDIYLSAGE